MWDFLHAHLLLQTFSVIVRPFRSIVSNNHCMNLQKVRDAAYKHSPHHLEHAFASLMHWKAAVSGGTAFHYMGHGLEPTEKKQTFRTNVAKPPDLSPLFCTKVSQFSFQVFEGLVYLVWFHPSHNMCDDSLS